MSSTRPCSPTEPTKYNLQLYPSTCWHLLFQFSQTQTRKLIYPNTHKVKTAAMLAPILITLSLLLPPAIAMVGPPANEGKPLIPPKVDPTRLENFTWSDPFSSPRLAGFDATCTGQRTFAASEYQLHDLQVEEPKGLGPYGDALRALFGGRPYPGGWEGMDAHGYERSLLKMEYADVPVRVRGWVAEQEKTDGPGKGLFGVYNKPGEGERVTGMAQFTTVDDARPSDPELVVIFAPGAVYETLPLWVAEASNCEGSIILPLDPTWNEFPKKLLTLS